MQPSGLIFLVIIAIWAAYLLQHWVRRREHLATARSVDRFSDAMRVLERRTLLSESDLSVPQPRSYAVSPARPSRSEVVVKRAQPPAPGVPTRAAVRPTRTFHALAGISARRVRGLSFLVSLVLVLVTPVLAAFSVLAWWTVAVGVVVLVADVSWLRHHATAARIARRANGPARAGRPASSVRADEDARGRRRSMLSPAARVRVPARRHKAPSTATVATTASPALRAPAHTVVAAMTVPAASTEGSTEALRQAAAAAEAGLSAGSPSGADLSGWAPVPVPPPTYTLKAKAERPLPMPAASDDSGSTTPTSFDGLVDEGELDGLLDRRRAAGA